tara:strand:- start:91 stop:459 length:369 start_codon:yes stop_codon:yes gene_type:complete
MEIDKKIIIKLIQNLEELKESLKNKINTDDIDTQVNVSDEEDSGGFKIIKSPIVGTAYLAPEPGAKKFLEIGKKIKKGDTVMIVEAMKTMNHIPSSEDGTVKKICVEDGQPIEFDQQLVILE